MSMYRTPIVVGDRVALAPHTDLWMAGCRFGTLLDIRLVPTDRDDTLVYDVRLDTGLEVTLAHDDLLGAVAGTPVGGEQGASPSTLVSDEEDARLRQRLIDKKNRCYSDHNHDIDTKGSCDYCHGTEHDR